MADPVDSALDLMRRLPPQHAEENLRSLVELAPHLIQDLYSSIDQPLKLAKCEQTGKDYLLCDYNKDSDSYRSPWSNEYTPALPDGAQPSAKLRKMEIMGNEAFETYRQLYFDSGASSVYMWDLASGFAAVVLIRNAIDEVGHKSVWDSIHVIEVQERGQRLANYKLTSTVMLYFDSPIHKVSSAFNLSGSLTRQAEMDMPLEDYHGHVANIGRIVEDMENKMRGSLQTIYFGKLKDISNDLRSSVRLSEQAKQMAIQRELAGKLASRHG